jgi:hypothetical protein
MVQAEKTHTRRTAGCRTRRVASVRPHGPGLHSFTYVEKTAAIRHSARNLAGSSDLKDLALVERGDRDRLAVVGVWAVAAVTPRSRAALVFIRRNASYHDRLHREDDPELCFATGHAVVGFIDFSQRKFFDHRAYAGVLGEA